MQAKIIYYFIYYLTEHLFSRVPGIIKRRNDYFLDINFKYVLFVTSLSSMLTARWVKLRKISRERIHRFFNHFRRGYLLFP